MKVKLGSTISLHLRITLANGTIADSTFATDGSGQPELITIGDGTLLAALEAPLIGLSAGEKKEFQLTAAEGFGERHADAIHTLKRSEFDPDQPLAVGLVIAFNNGSDDPVAGIITEIRDNQVKVDFNHPLAGQTLAIEVEVVAIH
ncbi:MAG: peptidylprolyl isomerase [Gammaproteobacteria bacterium]|nr:peptidylprolyl isomerase [Gammaproteobacteria bacterium]